MKTPKNEDVRVKTGMQCLDDIMSGGIPLEKITEFYSDIRLFNIERRRY